MTWTLILAFARKNWQAILAAVLIAAFIGWGMRGHSKAKSLQADLEKQVQATADMQAVLDAERAASAAAARQYEADHRAQMDAAAATARQREAALKTQMTGVRRALWTATENLASCRLDRDAVRLLRDAARGPAANQPATARTD